MEALRARLARHGIDVGRFGTGEAKRLEELSNELASSECELVERDGTLVRRLAVLNIDVWTEIGGHRRLVEDRQVFADGRERRRKFLPCSVSEKLHAGEDPESAVERALAEELGIIRFTRSVPIEQGVELRRSLSFPGLPPEYVTYHTAVVIDPSEHREEYCEQQPDKSTYFLWSSV